MVCNETSEGLNAYDWRITYELFEGRFDDWYCIILFADSSIIQNELPMSILVVELPRFITTIWYNKLPAESSIFEVFCSNPK